LVGRLAGFGDGALDADDQVGAHFEECVAGAD